MPVHELQDEQLKVQLMSKPVYELAGPPVGNELPERSHGIGDTSQRDTNEETIPGSQLLGAGEVGARRLVRKSIIHLQGTEFASTGS